MIDTPVSHHSARSGGGAPFVFWLVVLLGASGGLIYLHYRPDGGVLAGTPLGPYLAWVIWCCVAAALLALLALFRASYRRALRRSDFHLLRARRAEKTVGRLLEEIRTACGEVYGKNHGAAPGAGHPMTQWRAGHDTHTGEVSRVAGEITSLADALGRINESVIESAEGVRRLSERADHGAAAVRDVVTGINDTHGRVQEAVERLAGLSQNTRRFDEMAGLMGAVAERFNLLSLNAAFHGGVGGRATLAEAVEAAEEMRRLSDRAARTVGEITELARAIERDAADVIESLRETVEKAAAGASADEAGRALAEIESVGRKLRESTREAGAAAAEVARVQRISDQVAGLKRTADQTRADASRVVVGMENLRAAAGQAHSDVGGSLKR